ncbi:putative glutaredoxin [Pseudomonas phage OBP]|uniref:thioredoxin domain n=1 Tax=Pseudomonas phage OBP TaxID=1124849 RepID=UPI000240D609|nr:thioredoxin domain [Pseudomonas phage OBP]AEV89449.1 putative glutaredoxin [Pseudomonas phage OBP]
MNVVIYGKPNCPWCDRAKALVEGVEGITHEYVNIVEAGIDGAKLSEMCGEKVQTVPQIFVDGQYNKHGFQGLVPVVASHKANLAKVAE